MGIRMTDDRRSAAATGLAEDSTLLHARSIDTGLEIPAVNRHDDVQLVRTEGFPVAALLEAGCRHAKSGWWAPRRADFPFEALAPVLPRYAQRVVVPEIVDLIPATSWHASLANLLTKTSWDRLREESAAVAGGCEECGVKSGLECHEAWSYDERRGVQTLKRLRTVCASCHETFHLGLARVQGRFDLAFRRLARINRIEASEAAEYLKEVDGRVLRRSRLAWSLDLSMLSGRTLSLVGRMRQVGPCVVAGPTRAGNDVHVPLLGVKVAQATRTLTIS
jgi:hypothetical protein